MSGGRYPARRKTMGQDEPSRAGVGLIGWLLVCLIAFISYKVLSSGSRKNKRYFRRKVKPLPLPK